MNTEQAKNLSLPAILAKLGHTPKRVTKSGRELWYASPFRNERDPSFHTSFLGGKWIWNDFGDQGGTVIDFIMRYKSTNIKGALRFLDDLFHYDPISNVAGISKVNSSQNFNLFSHEISNIPPKPSGSVLKHTHEPAYFQLESALDFGSKAKSIMFYITSDRGINIDIAKKYLKEVHFRNLENGKNYFAAGFLNTKNGYEIRNPYFKSTVGEKAISHIENNSLTVLVFEGFIDFLSYLTDYETEQLKDDVIVLNSVSFKKQAAELITAKGYTKIYTFFDNDKTGLELTNKYAEQFKHCQFNPQNALYINQKDYNSALIERKSNTK